MSGCSCDLVPNSYRVFLDTGGCVLHRDVESSHFSLRFWIVVPGLIYNSHRADTGLVAENGIFMTKSPFYDSRHECDLSEYLATEKADTLPVGVQLFIDEELTHHKVQFEFSLLPKRVECTDEDAEARMTQALVNIVQGQDDKSTPDLIEAVTRQLSNFWLPHFRDEFHEVSPKFDAAAKAHIRLLYTQQQRAKLGGMDAVERAQQEHKLAENECALLRAKVKELEHTLSAERSVFLETVSGLRATIDRLRKQGDTKDWACTQCTFVNPYTCQECTICGQKRA